MGDRIFIVLPGHSVERDLNGTFRSTGLYQDVVFAEPGAKGPPMVRTGVYNPALHANSATAYLAGSEYVIEAACRVAKSDLNETIGEIVISGGRPAYLDTVANDKPGLSEGSVMFMELLSADLGVPISVFDKGLTTRDDMQVVLDYAQRPEAQKVLVIMMGFRIPRSEVLLAEMVAEKPEIESMVDEKIVFAAAEGFLGHKMDEVLEMTLSSAYARTMANERFAIRKAVQTGKAATTSGKT